MQTLIGNLFLGLIALSTCTSLGTAQSKSQTPCGPVPLTPCHEPPKCTGDGWQPGRQLPTGSGCPLSTGAAGQCNAGGTCSPAPIVHTHTSSGSISPDFYLVSVLYAPPGNRSSVQYLQGSSLGTTTSAGSLFGAGIKAGITGVVIADVGAQVSTSSSQSFQVSSLGSYGFGTTSTADTIRPNQDVFLVWTNPQLQWSQVQSPGMPVNITLATGTGGMVILPFTADELNNPSTYPGSGFPAGVHLTSNDDQNLLSADPFQQSSFQLPVDGNARFVPLPTSMELIGPAASGDNFFSEIYNITDSSQACTNDSTTETLSADFGSSVGPDFFGIGEKAQVVESITYSNTNSIGNCSGNSQTAAVTLSTSTVGLYDVVNVFEDTVYRSFAFQSATAGAGIPAANANITGTVKNQAGRAMPGVPITVTFANGHKRLLSSDASGTYRVFLVPPGSVTIDTQGAHETFDFASGQHLEKPMIILQDSGKPKPGPLPYPLPR